MVFCNYYKRKIPASQFANEPEVLENYKQFILDHQRELIEQRAATKTGQVVEKLFQALSTVTLETLETRPDQNETRIPAPKD